MEPKTIEHTIALASLESVIDPELELNVVDLGLIYALEIDPDTVHCTMSFTSSFCPMGESMLVQVEQQLIKSFPHRRIQVELTFEPPWGPDKISDRGREFLNERHA